MPVQIISKFQSKIVNKLLAPERKDFKIFNSSDLWEKSQNYLDLLNSKPLKSIAFSDQNAQKQKN